MLKQQMRQERTLQIDEINQLEKVEDFLNSKAVNSERTKKIYHFALSHFQTFLSTSEFNGYNIESILVPINERTIDVYLLLRKFIQYLSTRQYQRTKTKLSPGSISIYVAGVRSYLEYHDIDISPNKFKKRVVLPKKYYGNAEGIDAEDIRTLLLACTNTRLKVFLLVLASSGMRANEALSLRNCDVDFSQSPTKIHIRPGTSKTKQGNDVYISDEASRELKKFIDSKYPKLNSNNFPNDLVFTLIGESHPASIYKTLALHFMKLLGKTGMDQRKDGEGIQRREISFHLFRGFVKTVISNQGYGDYSEWILGHRSSMAARYYHTKEQERGEIYKKCMKYLTFLDYATVQSVGKDFESKLEERDKELDDLRQVAHNRSTQIDDMNSRLKELEEEKEFISDTKDKFREHWANLILRFQADHKHSFDIIKKLEKEIEDLKQGKSSTKKQVTKKRTSK